jgi:hypothetical protein
MSNIYHFLYLVHILLQSRFGVITALGSVLALCAVLFCSRLQAYDPRILQAIRGVLV